jgi:hypothetical protein
MQFDIEPFLRQGINLGIGMLIKAVPGGSVAFGAGCDALELAAKMILAVVPRIRDGNLSPDDEDAILNQFKSNVPVGTWNMALAVVKSALDRVIGGSSK